MSALSEQCEALRLWAKHLRECEPVLASDLREAADTILNLRDMAQQAQSEKAALERRIDELCQENERLRADQAHWELGNCPNCPNVVSLQEALEQNAKLRELVRDLYYETKSPSNHATQIEIRISELGIEVD